jgi:hypothetical protein
MDPSNEDNWDDTSSCNPAYKKTMTLQMAGGGSHAWWYKIEYDETGHILFIEKLGGICEVHRDKTLLFRHEVGGRVENVMMWDKEDAAPDDTDDWTYHLWSAPEC